MLRSSRVLAALGGLALVVDAVIPQAEHEAARDSGVSESQLAERLRDDIEGAKVEASVMSRPVQSSAWLHRFVSEACMDKLAHDQAAARLHQPVLSLAAFLMGWAKAKFGLKPTSAYHLWCLHHALNEHRKRSVEAATISLFLEMPPSKCT